MPNMSRNHHERFRLCELCLSQGVDEPATDTVADDLGTDHAVCDDHATALGNRQAESIADNQSEDR